MTGRCVGCQAKLLAQALEWPPSPGVSSGASHTRAWPGQDKGKEHCLAVSGVYGGGEGVHECLHVIGLLVQVRGEIVHAPCLPAFLGHMYAGIQVESHNKDQLSVHDYI